MTAFRWNIETGRLGGAKGRPGFVHYLDIMGSRARHTCRQFGMGVFYVEKLFPINHIHMYEEMFLRES